MGGGGEKEKARLMVFGFGEMGSIAEEHIVSLVIWELSLTRMRLEALRDNG